MPVHARAGGPCCRATERIKRVHTSKAFSCCSGVWLGFREAGPWAVPPAAARQAERHCRGAGGPRWAHTAPAGRFRLGLCVGGGPCFCCIPPTTTELEPEHHLPPTRDSATRITHQRLRKVTRMESRCRRHATCRARVPSPLPPPPGTRAQAPSAPHLPLPSRPERRPRRCLAGPAASPPRPESSLPPLSPAFRAPAAGSLRGSWKTPRPLRPVWLDMGWSLARPPELGPRLKSLPVAKEL